MQNRQMLGPLDLAYSLKVLKYLTNSPSPQEQACLEDLFRSLQKSGISADWVIDPGTGTKIIIACDHVTTIFVRQNGEGKVDKIERAWLPVGRP